MSKRGMIKQLSAACHFAYVRLALNYYMAYEIVRENTEEEAGRPIEKLWAEFHQYLGDFLEDACSLEGLDGLRSRVMQEMECLTSYTDCFQAYEYVLNRLERRFQPQRSRQRQEDQKALVDDLMSYVGTGESGMEQNDRIREIVGQLPVRFTRDRFFALVEKGLSVYKGGPREGFDTMLYILRSEALLNRPADCGEKYQELEASLRKLQQADYREMTPQVYRELDQELKQVGTRLADEVNDALLLMNLVNDLYVLCLTRSCVPVDQAEEQACRRILSGIRSLFLAGTKEEIGRELTETLSSLEGRQEYWMEQWNAGLSAPEVLESDLEERGELLAKVGSLLSGSAFMSLEREPEGGEVDEALFAQTLKQFREELEASWRERPKALSRAVMAKVLSSLPVFFGSMEELKEYVESSLESCSDSYEQATSMQLLRMLMESQER